MGKYVGLDRASKGWFGVVLTDDEWRLDLFPSMLSVWKYHSDATRVLVDVPIGLPSDGRRDCDVLARERLGPHQRRVFYAPIREAVYQGDVETAKRTNERAADYGVQNQAWSLVPRIREVDEFLDTYPGARDRLVETHPELCFYALNGQRAVEQSKTTEEGRKRRVALLAEEYPRAQDLCEAARQRFTTPEYAAVCRPHDVVDALAAAVTARRPPEEWTTLPESPPRDARGLPMRMVYPSDTVQTRLTAL